AHQPARPLVSVNASPRITAVTERRALARNRRLQRRAIVARLKENAQDVNALQMINGGCVFFFSSRRRHTRWPRDWSSDVCSSDLDQKKGPRISRVEDNHFSSVFIRSIREIRGPFF